MAMYYYFMLFEINYLFAPSPIHNNPCKYCINACIILIALGRF